MGKALQPPFVLKSLGTRMSVARRRRWYAILASLCVLLFMAQTVLLVLSDRYTAMWWVFFGINLSYLGNAVVWFVSYGKLRAGSGTAARG